MTAAQAIEPAVAAQASRVKPQTTAEPLPWVEDDVAPKVRSQQLTSGALRSYQGPATVHWSVVALTVATAMGIFFGAHGTQSPGPKELLPVMIVTTTAR